MKITKIKDENLEKHFRITVPAKDVEVAVNDELSKLALNVKMPGFRPGKVPLTIVQKKYGDSVWGDVINNQVKAGVQHVLKDAKFRATGQPSVEEIKADQGKDIEFTLKFDVFPEVKMPDFKKIKIEKPVVEVKDSDVNESVKKMAQDFVVYEKESKTKIVKGDQVTLDCVGYTDGKPFDGGKLQGHKLVIGSGAFIPGFEDQLIGSKAGDEVSVNVTFPEQYHAKDLAGKPSEFKVVIKSVHKSEESKLDDDFAKKLGAKDLADLKDKVEKNITSTYNDELFTIVKMRLFDKLESSLDFEVPTSMLNRELEVIKSQASRVAALDSKKKKDEKSLEESYSRIALRRVRIGLMLAAYAEENKITLQADDLREAILKQARALPGQENLVIDYFKKNLKAIESLRGPALEEKAVKAIMEQISATEKSYSVEEVQKLIEKESDRELF